VKSENKHSLQPVLTLQRQTARIFVINANGNRIGRTLTCKYLGVI